MGTWTDAIENMGEETIEKHINIVAIINCVYNNIDVAICQT